VLQLHLEYVRVHRDLKLSLVPSGLRISGPNGSGKSTIIEAIQLLSTTRTRRGTNDGDLINHASGLELGVPPYARVSGRIERGGTEARIEVFIQKSERRGASKKLLRVGDRARRASDVVGLLPTVSFSPDDLDLVLGAPSLRRRFLDVLLSQVDRQYLRALARYAKILANRNGLLREVSSGGVANSSDDQFAYWDEQLVALGAFIIAARVRAIVVLRARANARFHAVAEEAGALGVGYIPSIQGGPDWWRALEDPTLAQVDVAQRVGVAYEQQLRRSRSADLGRGMTLVGPHRDDVEVTLGGHDLARFGSRGQQRMAVVAIKLAEIDFARSILGLQPVLLLDDVLSELDPSHRKTVLSAVAGHGSQIIITATDRDLLAAPELADLDELFLDAPV
jgi:DNA replication and repair protein RecF